MAERGRKGRIVDVVEPGRERLELAWVREEAKGKVRLRTLGGREHALSSKALDEITVADHGPAADDPLQALARRGAEIDARRAELGADDVDLLWQAVAGDDDRRLSLAELAAELFGAGAAPARVSALGRALEADGERFALWTRGARFVAFGRRTRELRARRAEETARRAEAEERRGKESAERDARAVESVRGFLDAKDPGAWPADVDPFLRSLLAACRLDRGLADAAPDEEETRHLRAVAAEVEGSAEPWTVRALAERILLLRHPGESRTRRTRRLLGLSAEFPPEVDAAARAAAELPPLAGRVDLRALPAVTIDDPWTLLRDDALAVVDTDGGLEVLVHIADASRAVPAGSELDRAALLRGVTHYWPDGTIPMLPPALGEGRLSLDADGRPRDAFTARFRCAGSGGEAALEPVDLRAATVAVSANRTYAEVDEALAVRGTPEDALLGRLWDHLAAVRRRRVGEDDPPRHEAKIRVEGDGERIDVVPLTAGTPARRLIEELALATGMAAARWAAERDVPLVYRVQDGPSGDRRPERATYTLTPGEHHAMGELYAHVTSPLRRYVDLLNQRLVVSRLAGGAVRAAEQVDLQRITLGVREVLDRARDLEREAHRYWALRWLAPRGDEVFDGEVRVDPEALAGSRPPRVLVLPVAVSLPIDGAGDLLRAVRPEAEGAAASRVLRVRVRVDVRDPERLSARAVLVASGEPGERAPR
jgi:exoribonuclease-2